MILSSQACVPVTMLGGRIQGCYRSGKSGKSGKSQGKKQDWKSGKSQGIRSQVREKSGNFDVGQGKI
ncbi:hypothetical protein J6590_028021 [Homalodisca vitripennis]|nr:hypothetical protein J6590_028021 [Homalodisca vitripennis]